MTPVLRFYGIYGIIDSHEHPVPGFAAGLKVSKTGAHAAITDAAASQDRPAALADYALPESDQSPREGGFGPTVPKREIVSALRNCPSRPTHC